MGTSWSSVSKALFGKVRNSLPALLFCHSDESFFFHQIVRLTGLGQGAVQRELAHLVNVGLVIRKKEGNHVYYRANTTAPTFPELKSLMTKTCGVAGVLQIALEPLKDRIAVAFIYGSLAKGTENADSDVDVLIIGDMKFSEFADLLGAAQESIGREVNPSVYPVDVVIMEKVSGGHHFLTSLIQEPKIFLVGDEDVFERLVEKRLVLCH